MKVNSAPTDDQAVRLLEDLVRIPSPSCQEGAVAQACVDAMAEMGLAARLDAAGNAVGEAGSGERCILLLGHIDTVPGQLPVYREGDWLHGRGTVDAKGPFAAMICAAARAGLTSARVIVIGAVEEEAATSRGAYHVAETHPPADAVVIGEPSRWDRVTLGYKGRLLVEYRLTRPVSHTAGREQSACEVAVNYWEAVRDWAQRYNAGRESMFDRLDPSLRAMNTSSDGLADLVDMRIGLRLPLGLDVAELRHLLDDHWAGEAQVQLRGQELPYRASNRSVLTSAFLASIRSAGGQPAFVTKTGTSDMNVIGPRWKCPIVAYGPGDSAYDHTPEERISVSEYLQAVRVLTRVLRRLEAALARE
ncbi:MAG: [LysW]-lysine hydrolase [Chloroflexi bacterium]|nr:[LysW]-lysine hydrolase [Chloroflexota bacterium]